MIPCKRNINTTYLFSNKEYAVVNINRFTNYVEIEVYLQDLDGRQKDEAVGRELGTFNYVGKCKKSYINIHVNMIIKF